MPSSTARAIVQLTRPYNAAAMLLSFSVGAALQPGASLLQWMVGLGILSLLHSAGTLQNDIADMEVDRANRRAGPLLEGAWPVGSAKRLVALLTLAALALATLSGGVVHLAYAAALAFVAWAYNLRPLLMSHRPVWSLVALGLYYSLLPMAYGYSLHGGPLQISFAVLAAAWFVQRMSISVLKDYKDVHGDRQTGKQTFYIHYGKKITARLSIVLGILGYSAGAMTLLYWQRPHGLAGILFVCASLLILRNIRWRWQLLHASGNTELSRIFTKSFAGHNQYEAALLACLLLS